MSPKLASHIKYFAIATVFFWGQSQAQVGFSPAGCEFEVSFPAQPRVTEVYVPNLGNVQRADYQFMEEDYFVRAECMPITGLATDPPNDEYIRNMLEKYASANGLSYPSFQFGSNTIGKYGHLRGYKTVAGTQAIYEHYSYFGRSSYLSLYAGGPASGYPQKGIMEFFNTISSEQ